ncbi:condensation domain-containing protein, partial [Streptomyces sp. NPDC059627]
GSVSCVFATGTELARSDEIAAEIPYWEQVARQIRPLPRDRSGRNAAVASREVRVALDEERTSRLLHRVPSGARWRVDDVLLAALGTVLSRWLGGGPAVVDVESHGRHEEGPGMDLSRTVGWFTCLYPVALPGGTEPGRALADTEDTLRRVPRHGLGHGLLRHLANWRPPATAEIGFNYLGQAATGRTADDRFRLTEGPRGRARSPEGDRLHLVEILGRVADGRLSLVWSYSDEIHDRATISGLAHHYIEALGELIDACCRPEDDGCTPSEFPLAGLDPAALDLIAQHFGSAPGPAESTDSGGGA